MTVQDDFAFVLTAQYLVVTCSTVTMSQTISLCSVLLRALGRIQMHKVHCVGVEDT